MTDENPNTNGALTIATRLRGQQLLADPFLNKGSAFPEAERLLFGLHGLLPLHVSTMDEQLQRTYENYRRKETPLEKYIFLAALQDRNETLFYRLVQMHVAEMVPVIYTPTVGEACQQYSHIFRRARGLYLAYADPRPIEEVLENCAPDDVEVIVVTDGERILGLGDLGVGGMGIPVGKLALYTLCAGIHPRRTLPIFLDVGTNNKTLLEDPLYLGWRHPRLEAQAYDRFIDNFVEAVRKRWPQAILQWEDFSKGNAWRLLQRYRHRLATFNDDIQGTAAVTLAGLIRATALCGRDLASERIVIAGAGSAATGIADLLCVALRERGITRPQAMRNLWLVDSKGLVHEGRNDLTDEKRAFAQSAEDVRRSGMDPDHPITLETVIAGAQAGTLIGTSGQPGMFTESIVRRMAQSPLRPIIFPLSNPTSKSEATPQQLLDWTEGRALVATGSPFTPALWGGRLIPIGQCNNAFIFPGLGLGLVATQAGLVPEEAFLAAAEALAAFDKRLPGFEASLFPNLEHVREVSHQIALAVGKEILKQGLANRPLHSEDLPAKIQEAIWEPVYPHLIPASR